MLKQEMMLSAGSGAESYLLLHAGHVAMPAFAL